MNEDLFELSTVKKFELAMEVAQTLRIETENAIAFQQMHSESAYNETIPDAFNDSFEAWGYNVIIEALHNNLVLALMRIHDKAAIDTVSLHTLAVLLSDSEVVAKFEQDTREREFGGRANYPDERRKTHETRLVENRTAKIRSFCSDYKALKGNHLQSRLRAIRNQLISHRATQSVREKKATRVKPARYGDADQLLNDTLPIISTALEAVLSTDIDTKSLSSIWCTYAKRFWRRAAAGSLPCDNLAWKLPEPAVGESDLE